MTADQDAQLLEPYASELRTRFGVQAIVLFGSTARGEATESSDVDLLIEFQEPPTYEQFLDLGDWLQLILRRTVDLVTASAARPRLRARIAKEACVSRERDDLLADIKEAAERALRHVRGVTKEGFAGDEKTVDAVVRCLEVIGEAAKRVSPEDRFELSHLPWRGITGLRDRLVHGYLGTDLDIVWDVLTTQLRSLLAQPPFPNIATPEV